MPWARLEDNYFTHAKVINLSKDAKLLDLAGIAFSARELRDGKLSRLDMRTAAAQVDVDDALAAADELMAAGRWVKDGDGYAIHDYLKYNPSREEVLKERDASAKRVAEWRGSRRKGSNAVSNAVTNGVRNAGDSEGLDADEAGNARTNAVTYDRSNARTNGVSDGEEAPQTGNAVSTGVRTEEERSDPYPVVRSVATYYNQSPSAQARATGPENTTGETAEPPPEPEPEPQALRPKAQQCPICRVAFTGPYSEHQCAKIRPDPGDSSKPPRRRHGKAEPVPPEIVAELEAMGRARAGPVLISDEIRAEHERILARARAAQQPDQAGVT
jgi:hypothetical protein